MSVCACVECGGAAPFNVLAYSPGLWLDGADASSLYTDTSLTTNVAASTDLVAGWRDKSGNGRHFLQATSTARPQYFTSVQNGCSTVRFDGTEDYMTHTGAVAKDLVQNLSGVTIFTVMSQATSGATQNVFTALNNAGGARVSVNHGVTLLHQQFGRRLDADSGVTVSSSPTTISTNTFTQETTFINLSVDTVTLRKNGTQTGNSTTYQNINTGQPFSNTASTQIVIGASTNTGDTIRSQWLTGDIAELIVVRSAMTDADITAIEGYLRAKWGTG